MLGKILKKLENPERPFLGPNVKALKFFCLILPKNRFKKFLYMVHYSLLTLFVVTEYIDVWYVKSDITLVLNNLKITMLAMMSVLKATLFFYWQRHWLSVIEYVTRADIYQRTTTDPHKLQIINSFTKYSRRVTYLFWSGMYTTAIIAILQPIFKYLISESYRNNVKNGTEAYLPVVSSWVPFDKNKVPGYLAASAYQSYVCICGGGWISAFDTNAIVTMVFFRVELELLRIDCKNIFGNESESIEYEVVMNKFKDCHRRHVELCKFARLFDSCLSPIMLVYMFICSVMLCVTAYQINIDTSPAQRLVTTEFLVFGVAQLFIYCWHSNNVLLASQDMTLGPYESTWWMRDVKYRKDLYILIAQFNTDVVFSAGPFTKLTVTTFINILKGAYSYYTLLSNSQIN